MKIKKRNKSSRRMGRRTCFWGARKKHRGKGNKGGKGMAGSGKRADQKKTLIISKYGKTYFGKFGFKSIQQKKNRKLKEINLQDIEKMIDYFKKKGLVKESKDNVEINLKGYKILSDGELTKKLIIKDNILEIKKEINHATDDRNGLVETVECHLRSVKGEDHSTSNQDDIPLVQ